MKYLLLLLSFFFLPTGFEGNVNKDQKIDAINPTSTLGPGETYTSAWVDAVQNSNADITLIYRLRLVKN